MDELQEDIEGVEDELDETDEERAESKGDNGCESNPLLQAFLKKWDRDLDQSRRHFGIKVLFAGAESKAFRDGLHRIGVRHILVSYFYLRNWLTKAPLQEIADDLGRFDFVFLDSGGFTFIDAMRKGKDLGINAREYADQYYLDIRRFGHLFSACAEVDLAKELGYPYMEHQQKLCLDDKVPVAPVIQGDDLTKYESMGWFDLYGYLAVGSALMADQWKGYMQQVYELGKKRGIVFHGFGATGANIILRSQFYSVDSTSWLGGARFGTTMIFQNGRIRHYDKDKKDVRKRYKRRFEESGLIWADIEADKHIEVNMMNALAWKQWADYNRYNALRGYWLRPEEKDIALDLKSKAFNTEGLLNRAGSIRRAEHRRLSVIESADEDDRAHETLQCDTCHMNGRCPRYKPANPCGYDVNVRIETKADLQKALQKVLEIEYGRVMTGVLFEKLEGGVLDANLSNELKSLVEMVGKVNTIFDPRDELSLRINAKAGSGLLGGMLAGVFNKTGSNGSGSGSSTLERTAKKLANNSSAEPIDVPGETEEVLVTTE